MGNLCRKAIGIRTMLKIVNRNVIVNAIGKYMMKHRKLLNFFKISSELINGYIHTKGKRRIFKGW